MTFQEIVEYESGHRGTKFKRIDFAGWYLQFEPEFGELKMFGFEGKSYPVSLFHHDFYNGDWEIINEQ